MTKGWKKIRVIDNTPLTSEPMASRKETRRKKNAAAKISRRKNRG